MLTHKRTQKRTQTQRQRQSRSTLGGDRLDRRNPADAAEIAENLASIAAVPAELWPSAADLVFALHWARQGYDVHAYCSIVGIWNLWLGWRRIELGRVGEGGGTGGGTGAPHVSWTEEAR